MAQLWLFEDERPVRPTPRRTGGTCCRQPRRFRVRPLTCSRVLPSFEQYLGAAVDPGIANLLGQSREPEPAPELTRRERIRIRTEQRSERRDERRKLPKNIREFLRQDELSCEVLEMLDGWTGRPDNANLMGWMDRWIAEKAAETRRLWSRAEERSRRTGLTADQLDPNEHVLPHLCVLARPDHGGGDE